MHSGGMAFGASQITMPSMPLLQAAVPQPDSGRWTDICAPSGAGQSVKPANERSGNIAKFMAANRGHSVDTKTMSEWKELSVWVEQPPLHLIKLSALHSLVVTRPYGSELRRFLFIC